MLRTWFDITVRASEMCDVWGGAVGMAYDLVCDGVNCDRVKMHLA